MDPAIADYLHRVRQPFNTGTLAQVRRWRLLMTKILCVKPKTRWLQDWLSCIGKSSG